MTARPTVIALAATLALVPPAAANELGLELGENIEDLSLDDLLEREIVAASRYEQRSSDSPVLVSTITAEEIAQLGHRTLADALPTLAGVYVSNDRAYSYIGVRGFSIPGDYNTRVHLSIAGHQLTDPIYGQAALGREAGLPMAAVDRIEMVRGAAYSVYGAGALLGVIHVVPHSGRTRPGLHLDATTAVRAETFGDRSGRGSIGNVGQELSGTYGHHGDAVDVFVAAQANLRSGLDRIYFPELDGVSDAFCTDPSLMPRPCDGIVRGADDEVAASAYSIIRTDHWTVQAQSSTRTKRVPTASFDTTIGDPAASTRDFRSFVDATYTRKRGAITFTGRGAADYFSYRGIYPSMSADDGGAVTRALYDDRASALWFSGEGRVHWHADELGSHLRDLDVIAGVDATAVPQGTQWADAGIGEPPDIDRTDRSLQAGVYGEASARIADYVVATAGLRAAHLDDHGLTVHPRTAVMLDGGRAGRLRASAGTAFRAPNLYERHYWDAQPDSALRPETSRSYEVSAERYLGERIRAQVTAYHQKFEDLIVLDAMPAGLFFANRAAATGDGFELELEGKWDAVAARARYAYQHTHGGDDAHLANSPRSLFGANVRVPLAGGRALLGVDTSYVGRRLSDDGASVSPWFLTNATLTVPRLRGPIGATLGVTNLFDEDIVHPGGEDHRQTALPGDPRTVWLRLGIER